jgi:hypothetical protein
MPSESFTFAALKGLTNIARYMAKINPTYPIDNKGKKRNKYLCYHQ